MRISRLSVIRKLPPYASVPLAGLVVILALAAVTSSIRSPTPAAPPQEATTPAPVIRPAPAPTQVTPAPEPVAAQSLPPAAPALPATAGTAPAPPTLVPAEAIEPPSGIEAGWVAREVRANDQYGTAVVIRADAIRSTSSGVSTAALAADAPARTTRYAGWFHLDAASSLASLQTSAGNGSVTASIDGWPLPGIELSSRPQSVEAVLSLSSGWHQLALIIDQPGHGVSRRGDVSARISAGTDGAMTPVTIFALPGEDAAVPGTDAPAPAASADAPAAAVDDAASLRGGMRVQQ